MRNLISQHQSTIFAFLCGVASVACFVRNGEEYDPTLGPGRRELVPTQASSETACPNQEPVVCGINGKTYRNACEARVAGITVDEHGNCRFVCRDVLRPVCGEDGTTFGNPCYAANAGVAIAHRGPCKSAAN